MALHIADAYASGDGGHQAVPDQDWAPSARILREALTVLAWTIPADCMPGEANACGNTFAAHTASYLGLLAAMADHGVSHLDAAQRDMAIVNYELATRDLHNWCHQDCTGQAHVPLSPE